MAPEVFRHEEYNEKVDVYSFSLIVYWILTGNRPFADIVNPVEAARAAAEKNRKPNGKLIKPLGLSKMMQRAWAHDADERPDFEEILDEVKKYQGKAQYQDACRVQ